MRRLRCVLSMHARLHAPASSCLAHPQQKPQNAQHQHATQHGAQLSALAQAPAPVHDPTLYQTPPNPSPYPCKGSARADLLAAARLQEGQRDVGQARLGHGLAVVARARRGPGRKRLPVVEHLRAPRRLRSTGQAARVIRACACAVRRCIYMWHTCHPRTPPGFQGPGLCTPQVCRAAQRKSELCRERGRTCRARAVSSPRQAASISAWNMGRCISVMPAAPTASARTCAVCELGQG